MNTLSDELLVYILQYIRDRKTVGALSATNKHLRTIVTSEWGRMNTIHVFGWTKLFRALPVWVIPRVALYHGHQYECSQSYTCRPQFRTLQDIVFYNGVDDFDRLTNLCTTAPLLHTVHFFAADLGSNYAFRTIWCALSRLVTIRHIAFSGYSIDDADIGSTTTDNWKLNSISFVDCSIQRYTRVMDCNLNTLISKNSTTLKHLSMRREKYPLFNIMTAVKQCKLLTKLDFSFCEDVLFNDVCKLLPCKLLEEANFKGCPMVGDRSVVLLATRFPRLHTLHLDATNGLGRHKQGRGLREKALAAIMTNGKLTKLTVTAYTCAGKGYGERVPPYYRDFTHWYHKQQFLHPTAVYNCDIEICVNVRCATCKAMFIEELETDLESD